MVNRMIREGKKENMDKGNEWNGETDEEMCDGMVLQIFHRFK